jgi:hypothetical protein
MQNTYMRVHNLKQHKMKSRIFTLLLSLFLIGQIQAQTTVPALITSNQIWTAAGSPYLINQNTYLDTGVSVKVMPGAVITGSGSYTTLSINGEFQVLGNKDSLVQISGLIITYSAKSMGYNATTGRGAYMQFADVKGTGVANKAIEIWSNNFTINNSKVYEAYYAIYFYNIGYAKGILNIDKCEVSGVKGTTYHQGTILTIYGDSSKTYITNSTFNYGRAIQTYGYVEANKNVFHDIEDIQFGQNVDLNITCNTFKKMENGVKITLRGKSNNDQVIFENNTLDSCVKKPIVSTNYMFTIENFTLYPTNHPQLFINDNNFLEAPRKINIYGSNPQPTTYKSLNFKNNYWGTTNTAAIDTMIKDYADNINIYGKVDYSNYASSPVTTCQSSSPCPTPAFAFDVNDHDVTLYDSSTGSGTFTRIWRFDNAVYDTTTGGNVTRTLSYGIHYVCLFVYNEKGKLCDSFCQTIVVSNNSFCEASFYVAKDTANPYNMYIVNNSKFKSTSAAFNWDFGDGGSTTEAFPTHTYNAFGNYYLCLTITDGANNCNDQFCDTIGMDANGNYYKREGFTIRVLDERVINGTNNKNALLNSEIYPNPSTGLFNIKIEAQNNEEAQIRVTNQLGQLVHSENRTALKGINSLSIDLNNQENGVYFISLQLGYRSANYIVLIAK